MNRNYAATGTALSMLFAAALLTACGGSSNSKSNSNSEDSGPETVPVAAIASPEAFTQYLAARSDDERREPIAIDDLVPPSTETAEPLPVMR